MGDCGCDKGQRSGNDAVKTGCILCGWGLRASISAHVLLVAHETVNTGNILIDSGSVFINSIVYLK